MGNTANFQGSALYAVQHVLTIHGVWGEKKNKNPRMKPCLPIS